MFILTQTLNMINNKSLLLLMMKIFNKNVYHAISFYILYVKN